MSKNKEMGRMERLENAIKRFMQIPVEETVEIMEAYADGRLTIWPRTGQELWFEATGMCERCPAYGTADCKFDDYIGVGDFEKCPKYVSSEIWLGGEDTTQRDCFIEGEYFFTEEAAKAAILGKEAGQ